MPGADEDRRLEELVDGIAILSSGDLSNRLPVSAARDGIDAVTTGINLLAEGLEEQVAEGTAALEAARGELRRAIDTDELTGLASRSLLQEKVFGAVAAAEAGTQPALILLGLDSFRLVNDSLGPVAGDAVLREAALRLRAAAGPEHVIARLSGDEFAVLVLDPGSEAVLQLAARLSAALKDRILAGGIALSVTAAGGVRFGEPGLRGDELFRDATIAMHEAKKRGRDNILVFTRAMHEAARQRVHLAAELATAAASGQLELEYQPILDLAQGGIAGAEALIRWRHPVLGVLTPDAFLGAADEGGLAVGISHWVLRNAIAQTGRWNTAPGLPKGFSTHINLAPADLHQLDLAPYIQGLLAEHQLAPHQIAIEMTETAIMRGGPEVSATMASLHELGVPIEIDDFGTGYSSIRYLRDLPASQAKIDKALISDLATDSRQEDFVAAILQLIHSAGLAAVAEGIEHREQADKLRRLGCEFGQGYFFSRPLPVPAMTALLEECCSSGQVPGAGILRRWP